MKDTIEKEIKIKHELELEVFDAIINKDVQNYLEKPKILKEAREIVEVERFNLEQLKNLIREVRSYEFAKMKIRSTVLKAVMEKKIQLSRKSKDVFHNLPSLFNDLGSLEIYQLIRVMDWNGDEFGFNQHC